MLIFDFILDSICQFEKNKWEPDFQFAVLALLTLIFTAWNPCISNYFGQQGALGVIQCASVFIFYFGK